MITWWGTHGGGGSGISTDPGESNVLDLVEYEINGVPKVGSYQPVLPCLGPVAGAIETSYNLVGEVVGDCPGMIVGAVNNNQVAGAVTC